MKGVKEIKQTRVELIKDRTLLIKKYITGKTVLDLGCTGDSPLNQKMIDESLHKFLVENAQSVLGVDIDNDNLGVMKNNGFNVIYADVESLDLRRKFDVVVGGSIIEHLSNMGKFLDNIAKHLDSNGLLILTTPNVYSLRHILRIILFGEVVSNNNHTANYCSKTLGVIIEKHGYQVIEHAYFYDGANKLTSKIEQILCFFRPILAPRMIFVCKRKV